MATAQAVVLKPLPSLSLSSLAIAAARVSFFQGRSLLRAAGRSIRSISSSCGCGGGQLILLYQPIIRKFTLLPCSCPCCLTRFAGRTSLRVPLVERLPDPPLCDRVQACACGQLLGWSWEEVGLVGSCDLVLFFYYLFFFFLFIVWGSSVHTHWSVGDFILPPLTSFPSSSSTSSWPG